MLLPLCIQNNKGFLTKEQTLKVLQKNQHFILFPKGHICKLSALLQYSLHYNSYNSCCNSCSFTNSNAPKQRFLLKQGHFFKLEKTELATFSSWSGPSKPWPGGQIWGLDEPVPLMSQTLPFFLCMDHLPSRSGQTALGSHVYPDILLHSFLGC